MRYQQEDSTIIDADITAFCFWECGYIGINICDKEGRWLNGFDIPFEEAVQLHGQMGHAIQIFKDMESSLEQYMEKEEKEHGKQEENSDWGCAWQDRSSSEDLDTVSRL